MSAAGGRTSGTRLLAAVLLSACVGLIAGGLGAWGVYSHFGPVERVVTQTKNGGSGVSAGDIATTVQPSLVVVNTQPLTSGSLAVGGGGLTEGFAVSSDGLVMTSAHAIRGATRLRLATADGHAYDATIAATDVADGLVLLRATGAAAMTPLRIATADPHIGDLAVAVFHPPLGPLTTRSGVVAAVGITANDGSTDVGDLVAVDSTPAPLADGAPLVDGSGAVIGVVTTGLAEPGVMAASGRDAAALLADVQRGGQQPAATFGVTSVVVGAQLAAASHLPEGALIESVSATGPSAGLLQVGDVVTSVNGTPAASAAVFAPLSFGLLTGDRAVLQVTASGGGVRSVTITVG